MDRITDHVFECGNCGAQMRGYRRSEVTEEGWRSHIIDAKRTFWMCGECEQLYTDRRKEAA